MIFWQTPLKGSYMIDLEPIKDERGFFTRAYCAEEFTKHGLHTDYPQSNISYNEKKGIVRGMHYQTEPYEEVKIVRCVSGAVFDVIVDMREDSDTYLKWFGERLTADNLRSMYVPKGFAHGYQTLTDGATILYMTGAPYDRASERGVRWNDPKVGIEWEIMGDLVVSEKDKNIPLL